MLGTLALAMPKIRASDIRRMGRSETINKSFWAGAFYRQQRAKGQEWRIVRILNVVDGCIPSDRATGASEEIEEERRLLHVALTRAKDELDLIVPHRFFTHQLERYCPERHTRTG